MRAKLVPRVLLLVALAACRGRQPVAVDAQAPPPIPDGSPPEAGPAPAEPPTRPSRPSGRGTGTTPAPPTPPPPVDARESRPPTRAAPATAPSQAIPPKAPVPKAAAAAKTRGPGTTAGAPDAGPAGAKPAGPPLPANKVATAAAPRVDASAGGPTTAGSSSRDGGVAPRTTDAREPDLPPLTEAEIATGGPSPSDLMKIPMKGAKPRPPAAPPPLPIPGGPLAIPGASVDLRARRVERFLEEGGADLSGQVLDVDGNKPVGNAKIEAWMGTRSIHALADGEGNFSFEGLVPGSRITLWISASPNYVQERTEYAVPNGKPKVSASFKMIARAAVSGAQDGGVGVFLARRGNRTVVSGLVAFGAAERAGLNTGDALLSVGKRGVTELGPGAIEYLLRGPIGSEVAVTVQSGSQAPRSVTIKRTAR